MLGWDAMDGVNWSRLLHAYAAAEDTPDHLRALLSPDETVQAEAEDHLWGAVLHQGTVYPATPVAVRVVAGLLREPALLRPGADGSPLLASLITWLGSAAESAGYGPEPGPAPSAEDLERFYQALTEDDDDVWVMPAVNWLMMQACADIRAAAPDVVAALEPFTADADPAVRIEAVTALARFSALAPSKGNTDLLRQRLLLATDRDERATTVLALGRAGADVTQWLTDDDIAVRAMAALSARTDPRSTPILVDALMRPDEVDAWFDRRPPFFEAHPRFSLLEELLDRDIPFADLLPVALVVAATAGGYTADHDWGILLRKAFPDVEFTPGVRPPAPTDLDDAQRAFLAALAANDKLWDPTNGNAYLARMRVGLPDDRAAVAELAAR